MTAEDSRFAGRRLLALGGAKAAPITDAFEGAAVQSASLVDDAVRPRAGHQPVVTPDGLVASRLFGDAHVVVAVIESRQARALLRASAKADLSREVSRPVVVMTADDDLVGRCGADVLVFGAVEDRARYEAMAAEAGFDATNAVVSSAGDPGALLDQCAALLNGQDMRGSALPLRALMAAPDAPAPRSLLADVASRFARTLRGG